MIAYVVLPEMPATRCHVSSRYAYAHLLHSAVIEHDGERVLLSAMDVPTDLILTRGHDNSPAKDHPMATWRVVGQVVDLT